MFFPLKIIQKSTAYPTPTSSLDRSIHPLLSNEEAQLPFPQEIKQPPPLNQSSLAQTTVRSFFPCKNDARFRGTVAGYEHGSRLFITDSRATKQAAFRSVFQFRPILWDYSRTTRKRCAALVNVVSLLVANFTFICARTRRHPDSGPATRHRIVILEEAVDDVVVPHQS